MSGADEATLAFYEREAETYIARGRNLPRTALDAFIAALPAGARVLELGCGGGEDAEALIAAGFDVEPTDGSPAMAAIAERRLGRSVRVMRFDELDAAEAYDGVWANASLLHAREQALPDIFNRIHRALKPGGIFYATFKAGEGGDRDALGRYYNFPTEESLRAALEGAGDWRLSIETGQGGGYDNVIRTWLAVTAIKPEN
ncbi:MAG: class I SAM-dependent methyltransferase [Hyphomonadaceae bacterium]